MPDWYLSLEYFCFSQGCLLVCHRIKGFSLQIQASIFEGNELPSGMKITKISSHTQSHISLWKEVCHRYFCQQGFERFLFFLIKITDTFKALACPLMKKHHRPWKTAANYSQSRSLALSPNSLLLFSTTLSIAYFALEQIWVLYHR